MINSFLDTPIEYLKGVGPAKADLLKSELGIYNFYDLINYFPFRYVDKSKFHKIRDIYNESSYVQVIGQITHIELVNKGRQHRLTAFLKDNTGVIELVWFQGIKWIKEHIVKDKEYIIYGKPNNFNGKINIAHPEIEILLEREKKDFEYQAFYNSTEKLKSKGLDSKGILKLICNVIQNTEFNVEETLPLYLRKELNLLNLKESIINIHLPKSIELLEKAKFRLKFEEFFFIQLKIANKKNKRKLKNTGFNFDKIGDFFNNFYYNNLPFELTNAQKRVIKEIRTDMKTGRQMNRLLQGDVGSGKTLVALMSMLIAIDNEFQTCFIAPTEILAQQHYKSLTKLVDGLGLNIALLTGSTKASERKNLFSYLKDGFINILIGTHALFEDTVIFKNLGLVIIDEQHRFGVEQRSKMWKKNDIYPHILVMTATPIPRTLAMTLYGDLDVSIIDELPKGRKPIITWHVLEKKRYSFYNFIKEELNNGRQAYFVFPLIKESEKLDLKNLEEGYETLKDYFKDYKLGIVHGQMKNAEKEAEMKKFILGEYNILVSTTVIEVGVDVPNASVMVIENADRFGLSQLHQLRGRVGRGADKSYCGLLTDFKISDDAKVRISTMCKTNNGFEISEIDMRLRGPGEMEGTRQSGILNLKIADLVNDVSILQLTQQIVNNITQNDPFLENINNNLLKKELYFLKIQRKDWSNIS
ncbi:MAG: ATP-dependent DNA helicase RecG [Bacteroidetes bacterium GWE2_29_8]|nr:MAG: ATP-dependent DNA helicase RecG [Bacteroidetes bacterium GWE2_29_8]OFY21746.1 MAG: ATP-dependent DNA helicase RecG [Bacteroidetes bacterium GWF2_29_10]